MAVLSPEEWGITIKDPHLITLGHSIIKLKCTTIITIGIANVLQKKRLSLDVVTILIVIGDKDSIGKDLPASEVPLALRTSTDMDSTTLKILGLDVDNKMFQNVPGVDPGECFGRDLISRDLGLDKVLLSPKLCLKDQF
ncbi:hypothetical protein B5X24_HaOG213983 [Helicoverpa armigera]|nr:hypothetical protein B5X24_HaOG213983 [Helicoverpa armigera]